MEHPPTGSIERIEGTTMAVNSYVVTGPDGLVVVDAQLTLSDAAGAMMGAEWPIRRTFPNRLVDSGRRVTLGGVPLTVRDLGAGESHADTLWQLDDAAVFCGDVVYHGMHAYLADGRYGEWIDALDALHASLPDEVTLYVGHGEPGSKELLVRQRRYVEEFVDAVRRTADLDAEDRAARVTAAVQHVVPGERLLFLMQLSIEPVLATIRGDA
jgi:glyoxylase-like metal-dependent hydrolase (beta-lactamase superfamily II)